MYVTSWWSLSPLQVKISMYGVSDRLLLQWSAKATCTVYGVLSWVWMNKVSCTAKCRPVNEKRSTPYVGNSVPNSSQSLREELCTDFWAHFAKEGRTGGTFQYWEHDWDCERRVLTQGRSDSTLWTHLPTYVPRFALWKIKSRRNVRNYLCLYRVHW